MRWRKIIFTTAGTISSIIGITMIVWSSYNVSLSPTFLGYEGGIALIVFGGILYLGYLSHKPKLIKRK